MIKIAKLTNAEYINLCKQIHGDKYDYSETGYDKDVANITVICTKHGKFTINARSHVAKRYGCNQCTRDRRRMDPNMFIEKCKQVHGDKYDYSETNYTSNKNKIVVKCPLHGHFSQRAEKHLHAKTGCPKCANKYQTTEDFVRKSQLTHGTTYDYSDSVYINDTTKIAIGCNTHGVFHQLPSNHHSLGQGCPKCANKYQTTEDFLSKAIVIHGNKYDYSQFIFAGDKVKATIICPQHGPFTQLPYSHCITGNGCPICSHEKSKLDKPGYFCETLFRIKPELKDKPGKLYWVTFTSKDGTEIFDKIGITVRSVEHRFCSSEYKDYDVAVVGIKECTLYEAYQTEQQILKLVKKNQCIPHIRFSGWTECFKLPTIQKDQLLNELAMI